MRNNMWTLALASAGVIGLGTTAVQAEEQHALMTSLSQTTISGYVDTSAIWSPGSPNGILHGRTFDGTPDKLDGFNLHAVKLRLEKPLDEGQWSAGYMADLVFGPDANYYQTYVNGGTGGPVNQDDFAVKQAYVALRAPVGNGLDIRLGVWDTLIGYEVFESVNNPNFSRSYGYYIEPTHHTGVLVSYHVTDWLSASGGIANGWIGAINDRIDDGSGFGQDRKAWLGSLTITLPESTGMFAGSSIYAGIVYGDVANGLSGGVGLNNNEATSYYLGTTMTTGLEGLSVGVALDYRDDGPNAVSANNYAWAAALYASFGVTEKLKLNGRLDYAKGSEGTWYTSGGNDNQLGSATVTADYSLWANVVTRAELRYDRNLGGDSNYHETDADSGAVTLAGNFVYKF